MMAGGFRDSNNVLWAKWSWRVLDFYYPKNISYGGVSEADNYEYMNREYPPANPSLKIMKSPTKMAAWQISQLDKGYQLKALDLGMGYTPKKKMIIDKRGVVKYYPTENELRIRAKRYVSAFNNKSTKIRAVMTVTHNPNMWSLVSPKSQSSFTINYLTSYQIGHDRAFKKWERERMG